MTYGVAVNIVNSRRCEKLLRNLCMVDYKSTFKKLIYMFIMNMNKSYIAKPTREFKNWTDNILIRSAWFLCWKEESMKKILLHLQFALVITQTYYQDLYTRLVVVNLAKMMKYIYEKFALRNQMQFSIIHDSQVIPCWTLLYIIFLLLRWY